MSNFNKLKFVHKRIPFNSLSDNATSNEPGGNVCFSLKQSTKISQNNKFLSPQCHRLRIGSVLLGTGGFGSVYLGYLGEQPVAIKQYHRRIKNSKANAESVRAEARAARLVHPNIVCTLFSTSLDNNHVTSSFVVMEYVSNVTLKNVIDRHSFRPIRIERRLCYAFDIISALTYMHGQHLAHLDVKPANILITANDRCKLGDFGCSQQLDSKDNDEYTAVSPTIRSELTGTFAYRAPELFRGKPATAKADIYSFGIVLWQMVSRQTPFYGERQHVVIFGVVASNMRPALPSNIDMSDCVEALYQQLYIECWSGEVQERPTANDVHFTVSNWILHIEPMS